MADLDRLHSFIASLEPTCAVSEGIDKLYRLFSVLHSVATLYVEAKSKAKSSEPQDIDMVPIGNEFDVYLSALGFMPVDGDSAAVSGAAAGGALPTTPVGGADGDGTVFDSAATVDANLNSVAMNQTTQLGDWFSGNRYVMGLLEEDLSQFQPNSWASGV